MAAAAAAEAAASAAAAANSQDEEKAADTARRSAAGAFAGRVASMRPERVRDFMHASDWLERIVSGSRDRVLFATYVQILSHSYRMAQWHERNINDDILWKVCFLTNTRLFSSSCLRNGHCMSKAPHSLLACKCFVTSGVISRLSCACFRKLAHT